MLYYMNPDTIRVPKKGNSTLNIIFCTSKEEPSENVYLIYLHSFKMSNLRKTSSVPINIYLRNPWNVLTVVHEYHLNR